MKRRYPIKASKVIPSLWATALELSKGDVSRIQVVSVGQVIIHPGPYRPRKARVAK